MPTYSIQNAGTPPALPVSRLSRLTSRLRAQWQRIAGVRGTSSGDVVRHTMVLAAGSAAARLVGTLSIPVITRLYTPEQYGLFALFLSCTAFLMPIASLRYSAALPLPRREGTAVALLFVCLACLGTFVVLLAALFAAFSKSLFGALSVDALAPLWPLLVVSVAVAGLHEIFTSWSVRTRQFRVVARVDVTQSVLGGGLKIVLGVASLQRIGLIVGHIAAQAIACVALGYAASRNAAKQVRHLKGRILRMTAARYSDFPAYRLPSHMFMAFSQQAPLFFVGAIYGTAAAGQLGLAFVALALPLTLLGQTTGQAYYGEIAQIGRRDPARILAVTRHVTMRLLLLGIAPTLVLAIAGTTLFPLVFGAQWHDAGVFAAVLSIYLLAQFVANPLSHALNVFDKQRIFLRLNAVRAALIAGVFMLSYELELSAVSAMAAYSIALTVHYVVTSFSIFAVIRKAIAERDGRT